MGRHNKWLTDPYAVSYRIRNRSFRDARQLLIERSKRLEKKAARVARRQARAARQAEEEAALAAEQLQEDIGEPAGFAEDYAVELAEVLDEQDVAMPDDVSDSSDEEEGAGRQRLYPGSKVSVAEACTILAALAQHTSMTRESTNMLLNVMQVLLPDESSVPTSQYLLEKSINVDMTSVKKCFFCKSCDCSVVTEGDECENCSERIDESDLIREGKYFLMYDVMQKLKKVLEVKEVHDNLVNNVISRSKKQAANKNYASQAPLYYTDIADGDCYRRIPMETNDFTCSINTDGVNVFKSSTFSIWPIFLSINELSYRLRRKHTLLVGLWFGKNKPSFETFLKPFVDQCHELSTNGFTWIYNGLEIISKVYFVILSADSVARAPLQGLKQFNGQYGCHFCYNPGKCYKDQDGKFRKWIYPPKKNAAKRTKESWLQDLRKLREKLRDAGKMQTSFHGVLKRSPFIALPEFCIVDSCVVDYMHTALLGVLKTYTLMLIDSKNHKERYYLGTAAQQRINQTLLRCKVPSEVNRPTRDLKDVAYWKANEWKSWLIICIPVLKGILQERYLGHLAKLVDGVSLLISDKVSQGDIEESKTKLLEFYNEAAGLYGDAVLTYNMHLLTHAPDCVRNWGPLWAYSLFQFEHANGIIGGMFKGTRFVAMQIVKNLAIVDGIRNSESTVVKSPVAKLCLTSITDNRSFYAKSFRCKKGCSFVGPSKRYTLDSQEERRILRFCGQIYASSIVKVECYKTMILNGKKFSAEKSSAHLKIGNCVALLHDSVVLIRKLLLVHFLGESFRAVCLTSNVYLTSPYNRNTLVYRVSQVADAFRVSNADRLDNVKFITMFDGTGNMTHVCKLANSQELE